MYLTQIRRYFSTLALAIRGKKLEPIKSRRKDEWFGPQKPLIRL
jgi:hypothetical protein